LHSASTDSALPIPLVRTEAPARNLPDFFCLSEDPKRLAPKAERLLPCNSLMVSGFLIAVKDLPDQQTHHTAEQKHHTPDRKQQGDPGLSGLRLPDGGNRSPGQSMVIEHLTEHKNSQSQSERPGRLFVPFASHAGFPLFCAFLMQSFSAIILYETAKGNIFSASQFSLLLQPLMGFLPGCGSPEDQRIFSMSHCMELSASISSSVAVASGHSLPIWRNSSFMGMVPSVSGLC